MAQAGAPYDSSFVGISRCFPSPAAIVTAIGDPDSLSPDRVLRLPRSTTRAVHTIMTACAEGALRLNVARDPTDLYHTLVSLPRIRTWTARYFMMRFFNHPDLWPKGDVALIAGAQRLKILPQTLSKTQAHRQLEEIAQQWSPWRSYAAMHLWRSAS